MYTSKKAKQGTTDKSSDRLRLLPVTPPKQKENMMQAPIQLKYNFNNQQIYHNVNHHNPLKSSHQVNKTISNAPKISSHFIEVHSNNIDLKKHLEVRKKFNQFLQNKSENGFQSNLEAKLKNVTNSYMNVNDNHNYDIDLLSLSKSYHEIPINSKCDVYRNEKENSFISKDCISYGGSFEQCKTGRESLEQSDRCSPRHIYFMKNDKVKNKKIERNNFM